MFNTRLITLLVLGLLLLIGGLGFNCTSQDTEMEFKEFEGFDLEQLRTLQAKLTYVGWQEEPIPTVAFTSPFNVLDMAKFEPFRRPGFPYHNDDYPDILTFNCSTEELQRIIKSVGEIEAVRRGEVIGECLSFMMYNTTPAGEKAHEAILDTETSRLLVEKIKTSLDPANEEGIEILDYLAQILY